jgi:uncharacterized membrane protein YcaP (DUF421 family)
MWADLWHLQIPLLEKVLRTVLVYGGLAVLLRLGGKRELAQLNSFDLVVMLLLSNVVQNSIIGNDNSLAGGLLGAAVLVAVNSGTVRLVNRHPWLTRLFEGSSTRLVHEGRIDQRALHRIGLRRADLAAALRRQGASNVGEVREASLAPGGSIVVTLDDAARDVTRSDLRADHEALVREIRAAVDTAIADLETRLLDRLPATPPASTGPTSGPPSTGPTSGPPSTGRP